MPDQAPLQRTAHSRVQPVGAGADATEQVCVAPFDGTVTAVTYTPDTTITGANTNSRTISLVNKGQAGAGTTSVATLALTSGVNAPAADEKALTLSGTPANLVVASGDVLEFDSTHIGTGIADPGGLVQVTFSRS
jgi:hypothetical protein